MRLTRDQLAFMGLVALDEVNEQLRRGPYDAPFALRVVLAMLFSMSDGDRSSFDEFWRASIRPVELNGRGFPAEVERSQVAGVAYNGICRSLGFAQTINFCSDISAARTAPFPHTARNRHAGQSPEDAARQAFAEQLRAQRGKPCQLGSRPGERAD